MLCFVPKLTEADSQAHFLWMLLAFAIQSAAIVWIYAKGNGGAWLGQGIRFGIAIWAVSSAFMYLIYYSVQPLARNGHRQRDGMGLYRFAAGRNRGRSALEE